MRYKLTFFIAILDIVLGILILVSNYYNDDSLILGTILIATGIFLSAVAMKRKKREEAASGSESEIQED